MIEVEVKVIGPGGCVNFPYELIMRALQAVNADVEYVNEYYKPNIFSPNEVKTEDLLKNYKIKLVADHRPWGG
jgi:hypothetical protein